MHCKPISKSKFHFSLKDQSNHRYKASTNLYSWVMTMVDPQCNGNYHGDQKNSGEQARCFAKIPQIPSSFRQYHTVNRIKIQSNPNKQITPTNTHTKMVTIIVLELDIGAGLLASELRQRRSGGKQRLPLGPTLSEGFFSLAASLRA